MMIRLKAIAAALCMAIAVSDAAAQDAAPGNERIETVIEAAEEAGADTSAIVEESVEEGEPIAVPSVAGGLASAGTMSDAALGQPLGGWDIQPQVTALGQRANNFNTALLIIMAVITLFVFGLLFWTITHYRRRDGRLPSKTTHNIFVEVLWTLVPVLVLAGIAVPSFGLLNDQYDPPEADLTIKAIGHQWYWEYEYPDQGGFAFDAIMLDNEAADAAGEPRLLATDNRVVVPVDATVKVLVTSVDVLHSWAMPAFWVKMDAVPGKINETWFRAEKPGVYYGQCSELCGARHGFMPIAVEVVEQDVFDAWVGRRQSDAGIDPDELIDEEEDFGAMPGDVEVPTAAAVEVSEEAELDPVTSGEEPEGMVVEGAATGDTNQ